MLHNEDFFPAPKQEENYWKPKSKRNLQKQQSGKENTVFRDVAMTGSPALATVGIQEVRTRHSLVEISLRSNFKNENKRSSYLCAEITPTYPLPPCHPLIIHMPSPPCGHSRPKLYRQCFQNWSIWHWSPLLPNPKSLLETPQLCP